ncbi:hypothetical protein CRV24_000063 [Beauveria bassiana]|nr:hypothetical protein CRV24_000063 [Beauveria bassiana]
MIDMDRAFTTMPRQAYIFELGLHSAARNTTQFDALIRDRLSQLVRNFDMMDADSPPTPPAGPLLSEGLLQDPYVCQVAIDVNNRSAKQTSLADFTTVCAVDVTISRLRKIRDLAAKFSQDAQAVWRPHGGVLEPSSSSNQAAQSEN